ncbi:MAG: LamG domain-containing protein [Cytophaga sp.]|uniref:LamG domain-containing protein n=1 Tax=Cytophaga sp. TaxID=29535 RepID=UPI003F7FC445
MKKNILIGFIFLLQISKIHAQIDLEAGLVGDYAFAGNAQDASMNGNNATVNDSSPATGRGGCTANAYSFDGIHNHISFSGAGLDNKNYSYSVWVNISRLPSLGNAMGIMSIGNAGADQTISLTNNYTGGSSGFGFISYFASATQPDSYSTGRLPATNTWYHLVAVRDNTTLKLYINGTLAGKTLASSAQPYYEAPVLGTFGARNNNIQNFKGRIDDVRIYNRAINSCEVKALYELTTCGMQTRTTISSDGLLLNYYFNANAKDVSGNNNNGTVNNDATLAANRFGNPHAAYSFDGIDDNISFSVTGLGIDVYSYSVWVNIKALPSPGNAMAIMSIGNADSDQTISITNNYDGTSTGFDFSSYSNAQSNEVKTGTLPAAATWYHLVAIRDNSTLKLYINGAFAGQKTIREKVPSNPTAASGVLGAGNKNIQNFNGRIDDVKIYNRAISECEVQELYAEPEPTLPSGTPPPILTIDPTVIDLTPDNE